MFDRGRAAPGLKRARGRRGSRRAAVMLPPASDPADRELPSLAPVLWGEGGGEGSDSSGGPARQCWSLSVAAGLIREAASGCIEGRGMVIRRADTPVRYGPKARAP